MVTKMVIIIRILGDASRRSTSGTKEFFKIKKPNPLPWYLGGRLKDPKRIFDFDNF